MSPATARTLEFATVVAFASRVQALLDEAGEVQAALGLLGKAGVADAGYACDCLTESTQHRTMGGLDVVAAALTGLVDQMRIEPQVVR